MQTIVHTLHLLDIGTPGTAGTLTLFPLLRKDAHPARYRLLDEALEANLAEITEICSGGSVPELRFRNKSDQDILLVDGEELRAGKQNRVLNLTLLVGAGQDVTIPVSCVEAGRWTWRSARFSAGRRKLNAQVRTGKMHGVSAGLRESGAHSKRKVEAADTLAKLLPKLVDSYAFDALESDVDLDLFAPPPIEQVRALLDRIAQAPVSAYAAVAKGMDVCIDAPGLNAMALIDDERTVHLSAFAPVDE